MSTVFDRFVTAAGVHPSKGERDGLVTEVDGASDDRRVYRITDSGRAQLTEWYTSPTGGDAATVAPWWMR